MFKKIKPIIDWVKKHKYISVTIAFLLIIFVFDDNNVFKHYKNKSVIENLEDEIAEMKRDSAEIVNQDERFSRGDVKAVEDIGREKYGMQKDDEDRFEIE